MQAFRVIGVLVLLTTIPQSSTIKIETILQGYINTSWKFQKSSARVQDAQIIIEVTTEGPGGVSHISRYSLPNSRIEKKQAQVKTKTGYWMNFGSFQEDSGQIKLDPQVSVKTNLSETLLVIEP